MEKTFPNSNKKNIAICIPCFNEELNIDELYFRITKVIDNLNYNFSIIFEDNKSTDKTISKVKKIMKTDSRVGLIENNLNYGFVKSSTNVLLSSDADASIFLMADLQDPPELIKDLIKEWEKNIHSVIFCVRKSSKENKLLFIFKKIYYFLLEQLSDFKVVRDSTGFGIYDRKVIQCLRELIDSYPFVKGLVCACGFSWSTIKYTSQKRKHGKSSASLLFLIDFGILGLVTLSRKPMRYITFSGLFFGSLGFLFSTIVVFSKIIFWNTFQFGVAMLSSASLFLLGIILFSIGIIGEYISFIHRRSLRLPLLIEKERINVKPNKPISYRNSVMVNISKEK